MNNRFYDSDLRALILEYGVKNIRFYMGMRPIHSLHGMGIPLGFTSSDDPEIMTLCSIDEERYRVSEGYKIKLVSVDGLGYFASETYYQSDLASMMRKFPDEYQIWVIEDYPDVYRRLR